MLIIFRDVVVQLEQFSCKFSEEKSIVSVNSKPRKAGMAIHLVDDERDNRYRP